MTQEDIIRMAREASVWLDHSNKPEKHMDFLKRFAAFVFEHGRQEGMKQERALWPLTKLGREVEAQRP